MWRQAAFPLWGQSFIKKFLRLVPNFAESKVYRITQGVSSSKNHDYTTESGVLSGLSGEGLGYAFFARSGVYFVLLGFIRFHQTKVFLYISHDKWIGFGEP